ncbi:ZP domain-containing protein-like [Pungitius pungitius]|uniref:ZP domain-containing protein-like n=1 Tax=Pungitius pungitius TaxID=134920 RepID=UPI002E10F4FD
MDETGCELRASGLVAVGDHVFELFLEDFPRKNLTLRYAGGASVWREASDANAPPLCQVLLQFSMKILPPIASCEAGHGLPEFLSQTASHRDVLLATIGHMSQLSARARAHHTSIYDFQVSGPHNMNKVFRRHHNGEAEVTLSWTPEPSDLYRSVPVCFTAETDETQSDMRCVVVMATQAAVIQGDASVTCSPNKMMVALEKASMAGIDVNYLKLRDPSCSLTANATHILAVMSFSTCGTKLQDQGDFLIFNNEINSYVLPTEVITRRKKVKIAFNCRFPKTISISSYFNLHNSDYIFTESSFGSFGYTFEIFTNSNFTSKVAYPVEVRLLEMIYMGIQAESDLPNVNLFVESCKATPDENPDNRLSYDLIKNGCQMDKTIIIHKSNETSFNFEVQAFKFTGNYDQVYITCSVILCEAGSPFSRCAQGCLNDPSRRRRKRLASRETVGHLITQGPLQFVRQAPPNRAVDDNGDEMKQSDPPAAAVRPGGGLLGIKEALNTNISTVVFACTFCVSLGLMAALIGHFMRKRKDEDRKSLLVSQGEN